MERVMIVGAMGLHIASLILGLWHYIRFRLSA